jgi:hypothetical protein
VAASVGMAGAADTAAILADVPAWAIPAGGPEWGILVVDVRAVDGRAAATPVGVIQAAVIRVVVIPAAAAGIAKPEQ